MMGICLCVSPTGSLGFGPVEASARDDTELAGEAQWRGARQGAGPHPRCFPFFASAFDLYSPPKRDSP